MAPVAEGPVPAPRPPAVAARSGRPRPPPAPRSPRCCPTEREPGPGPSPGRTGPCRCPPGPGSRCSPPPRWKPWRRSDLRGGTAVTGRGAEAHTEPGAARTQGLPVGDNRAELGWGGGPGVSRFWTQSPSPVPGPCSRSPAPAPAPGLALTPVPVPISGYRLRSLVPVLDSGPGPRLRPRSPTPILSLVPGPCP